MSYQRWTQGDAYVIAIDDGFDCVACDHQQSKAKCYREIIEHLETYHTNSSVALTTLRHEAAAVGMDANYDDYWEQHEKAKYYGGEVMDWSKLLQALLAQFQNIRINWVALLFDPEFHAAVAALVAVIQKHTTASTTTTTTAFIPSFDIEGSWPPPSKRKK